MKISNIRLLMLAVASLSFILGACKKSTDTPQLLEPSITFDCSAGFCKDDSVAANGMISIKAVFTKGNDGKDLKSITIQSDANGTGNFTAVNGSLLTPSYASGTSEIQPNAATSTVTLSGLSIGTNDKIAIKFRVEDKDGNNLTRTITIYKKSGTTTVTAPKSYSGKTLTYDNTGTAGNGSPFFSSKTGTAMSLTAAQAAGTDVDFYYFFSTTSGQNLVAGSQTGNSLLTAKYMVTGVNGYATDIRTTTLSLSDFNGVVDQSKIAAMYNAGTQTDVTGWSNTGGSAPVGSRATNSSGEIAVGKVLAFKGAGGKYGLIYVSALNPTTPSGTSGSMTFDMKVEN